MYKQFRLIDKWFQKQLVPLDNWSQKFVSTVKLGFKELLKKEQIGNSEPFFATNLPVYLINIEQIGISEQFYDDQKVP